MINFLLVMGGLVCLTVAIGFGLFVRSKPNGKTILKPTQSIIIGILGLFLLCVNGSVFYVQPGYSYLVQYIWGKQTSVTTPGIKFKFWGQIIPFKKVLTVRFVDVERIKNKGESASAIEPHIPVRFNDAVTADVGEAIRFRMPSNKELFLKMAIDFRSMENLITSCLKPTCREATRNSARVLAAQEYIAGKGGEFEQALQDQLESGIWLLETIEQRDSSDKPISINEPRLIESKKTVKYIVKSRKNDDGSIVRKSSPFAQYGITLSQAAIDYVDFEPKFKEMLGKQRDAAAEANVERQQAKKAEFEKQKIIAVGEKDKAKMRAEMERDQVETLIKAETEKKQMSIKKDMAQIALERAKLESKSKKVLADAEAYQKRAVMKADNALEIRLNTIENIHMRYADAISKHSKIVPDVIIGENKGGNNATDLINLLTAQTAKQLGLDAKSLVPSK